VTTQRPHGSRFASPEARQAQSVPPADPSARPAASWASDLVAQVQGRGRLESAHQVEFDVLRGKVGEEPSLCAQRSSLPAYRYVAAQPRLSALSGSVRDDAIHLEDSIQAGEWAPSHC